MICNKFECFSLIGVLISILYFCTIGFISELVASEECLQLDDEFDLPPIFETNESLFLIDNDKMTRSNDVVYDNFVLKYNNYPETLINSLINRNSIFDKSARNQQIRFIPDTVRLYNTSKIHDLCETERTTIQPQAAKDNSRWIVVINQKDFVQSVPVEQCVHKDNMRSNLKANLLNEPDRVMCQQAISMVDLYVIINNKITQYNFPYPSACEPYNIY